MRSKSSHAYNTTHTLVASGLSASTLQKESTVWKEWEAFCTWMCIPAYLAGIKDPVPFPQILEEQVQTGFPSPRCSEPSNLYHDISKRSYTGLLALHPTAFNRAGMGSRGLGRRDRDRGRAGSLNSDGMAEYREGGALGEHLLGSGGSLASCCSAKGHPIGNQDFIRHQDMTQN